MTSRTALPFPAFVAGGPLADPSQVVAAAASQITRAGGGTVETTLATAETTIGALSARVDGSRRRYDPSNRKQLAYLLVDGAGAMMDVRYLDGTGYVANDGAARASPVDVSRGRYDPRNRNQLAYELVSLDAAMLDVRYLDGSTHDTATAAPAPAPPPGGSSVAPFILDSSRRRYDPTSRKQIMVERVTADGAMVSADLVDGAHYPGSMANGIVCWGDSITELGWPELLGQQLNRVVVNAGIGSQTDWHIMGRQGATAYPFVLANNRIVRGANTVVSINGVAIVGMASAPPDDAFFLSARAGGELRSCTGTLGCVHGTLEMTASGGPPSTAQSYTFTPDAGEVSAAGYYLPPGTAFVIDNPFDKWVNIFETVRNNYLALSLEQIGNHDQWMVARLRHEKFLVMSVLNAAYEPRGSGAGYDKIVAIEAQRAAMFPRNFLPMRRYLIDKGLADLGIAPTQQDLADMTNDVTPTSLRGLNDALHPSKTSGAAAMANCARARIQKERW